MQAFLLRQIIMFIRKFYMGEYVQIGKIIL